MDAAEERPEASPETPPVAPEPVAETPAPPRPAENGIDPVPSGGGIPHLTWYLGGGALLVIITAGIVFLLVERHHLQRQLQGATPTSNSAPSAAGAKSDSGHAAVTPAAGGGEVTEDPAVSAITVKGCDISHWDGEIDWPSLKRSGIAFLYIKCSQGTTYVDPDFEKNWASAANYGLVRGAYHFYQPGEDPKAQAEHFLATAKHAKGDLLPVLDIEISHGMDAAALGQDVGIWVETVKAALGRCPMIYTDKGFWDSSVQGDFSYCPLWIADWENSGEPNLPTGWKIWTFWQYAQTGTVDGIANPGKVDVDYFAGSRSGLSHYQLN